jgi:hypothetical protein
VISKGGVTRADQVRMAQDVAGMFDELRALADRHADRARLEAELDVRARTRIGSVPTILLNLSGFGMNWIAPARMPAWGDAIERAEIYDKLSQLNPLGQTALKPAVFLGFVPS